MDKYFQKILWVLILLIPIYVNAQVDTSRVKPKPVLAPMDSMRAAMADSTWRSSDSLFQSAPKFADSLITFDPSASNSFRFDSLRMDTLGIDTGAVIAQKERLHWQKLIFAGKRPPFDPKVAWQRSLIIPGWGQIYNKSYWKLPIVYGGYVALGFYYNYQDTTYQNFRKAYLYRVDNDPSTEDTRFAGATDDGVRQARDRARRQRDYAVLYIIGFHLFQVLDAFVDAHLKNFDVSEDLSLNTKPRIIPLRSGVGPPQYAVGLSFNFEF